jgi:hypothetical protein
MITLLGSVNYTLRKICDGMTITKDLSNTRVKTSIKAFDG